MKRLLIFTLLMPLMLFVSVGSKACDDSGAPSYLKGGLVETAFELPSAEVSPDVDDVLLPASHANHSLNCSLGLIPRANADTLTSFSYFTCRGPPTV